MTPGKIRQEIRKMRIRYIFFDADDTLWENELFFRKAEEQFVSLLSDHAPEVEIRKSLAEAQEENIPVFGYGSKTYLIAMTDCAARICPEKFNASVYKEINRIVRNLAGHEIKIIDGVRETLEQLYGKYRLAVATKGDLKEQTAKFRASGLGKYFHHIEVLENKDEKNYALMARKLDISPGEIIMAGNSVKSDIAPVISLGGYAVHVPHEIVWEHEKMDMPESEKVFEVKNIRELPNIIERIQNLAQ